MTKNERELNRLLAEYKRIQRRVARAAFRVLMEQSVEIVEKRRKR